MKVNHLIALFIFIITLTSLNAHSAVTKNNYPDASVMDFAFIENNTDNNFFVTPLGGLNPRMTGANQWTGLKYNGSGTTYQQSLGYIDNGHNTKLNANWRFDMWLENITTNHPLSGLRCINWYSGCNLETSLILPQFTDNKGFYGVTVPAGASKWMHGMMSNSFYQTLKQLPLSGVLYMQINTCQTSEVYNATEGGRCKDQKSGKWYTRNVSHRKGAHLALHNTNSLSEVFINSDGIPLIGEGNSDCKVIPPF